MRGARRRRDGDRLAGFGPGYSELEILPVVIRTTADGRPTGVQIMFESRCAAASATISSLHSSSVTIRASSQR